VLAAWWHEQQDEVMDGFFVEPQNQGRSGTTWEPSHEWRLAEATPSSRGFQRFTGVDGVYSYQTSYGFASAQIPRRSQGTLLPSSGEPMVSNPWNNVQLKDSIW
jgi:hypothetical protein